MSKIFLAAVAIAVTMTMASAPNAWGAIFYGKTFNGLNLANGTSHEALGSAALIAVELQH